MSYQLLTELDNRLQEINSQGLHKIEYPIDGPQQGTVTIHEKPLINMCSNNYLGLAADPRVLISAHEALDSHGYGMASVRFICGTQNIHKQLEDALSNFLRRDDTILFSSCFDANAAIFEAILTADDCVLSDELNHASIIDGIRLCKATRKRYRHGDMGHLEECLKQAESCTHRLIVTDGVFSMDGTLAKLPEICALAEKYNALVMVDDSHATGFMGPKGRGTPEMFEVEDRVHILSGTLGKALGGASGGYISGKASIISWLRQRARPYLFSNSLAPVITKTSLHILKIVQDGDAMRQSLQHKVREARQRLLAARFHILGHPEHPIIPIMIGDAIPAEAFAKDLISAGILAISFSYPVVPLHKARVRLQISEGLSMEDLSTALDTLIEVARKHTLIP
ncbi:MAG: glycine C-acetyltransferase [Zetaproteobacteria bacterium]|nr:glycine C-acetyltransferase [Zetaproteobacteria bacterium]